MARVPGRYRPGLMRYRGAGCTHDHPSRDADSPPSQMPSIPARYRPDAAPVPAWNTPDA